MLSLLKRIAAAAVTADTTPPRNGAGGLQSPADIGSGPCQIITESGRIEQILRDLQRQEAPVMLNARGQAKLSPVRLKSVDSKGRLLLVTQLWSDAEHAALMADPHVNLSAHHLGLPVFFTVDVQDASEIGGAPCYRMPFPAWILSMEMRSALRVRLPEELRACLQCSLAPDLHVDARLIDVSEGGACFAVPTALAERIGSMTRSFPARFHTRHEEIGTLHMHLCRSEQHGNTTFIGATIELDSELGRRGLRRLIMAHQRNPLRLQ